MRYFILPIAFGIMWIIAYTVAMVSYVLHAIWWGKLPKVYRYDEDWLGKPEPRIVLPGSFKKFVFDESHE